jgi:hypothetical protein
MGNGKGVKRLDRRELARGEALTRVIEEAIGIPMAARAAPGGRLAHLGAEEGGDEKVQLGVPVEVEAA